MASVHRPLRHQSAARMRQERRDRELVALFGREIVEDAHRTEVCDLHLTAEGMELVHDAADELLMRSGEALEQRRIVSKLDRFTRLVLCMWLVDLDLAASLAARAIQQPSQVRG
jgi:hypothetical protein